MFINAFSNLDNIFIKRWIILLSNVEKKLCQTLDDTLVKTNKHNNIGNRPDLNSVIPVTTGAMASGNGWQSVKFGKPATGRYIGLQCFDTQDGTPLSVAEIYLRDVNGQRIARDQWQVKYANSENENGNHTGDKAFDLQESTYWQTEESAEMPHLLVISLMFSYSEEE